MSVWVTGMGTVNVTGHSPQELWDGTLSGKSFISDKKEHSFFSMTLHAMSQAMQAAGWKNLNEDDALFFATTTGQIPLWEGDVMDYLDGKISSDRLAETLSHEPLGASLKKNLDMLDSSRCHTKIISSACSASTQALVLAAAWLRSGKARRCLVGGTELSCQLTGAGFQGLRLVSSRPATPFDSGREGINLSEASAFLCLEKDPSPSSLACLSGGGLSTDGYHMTAPDPQGGGILRAMTLALKSAGLKPEEISWIHAHGTGSLANDAAEVSAIRSLFEKPPVVSSTKPVHGHALAVSGVLESIISILSIRDGIVPQTLGLVSHDWAGKIHFPKKPETMRVRHVLKNSLGFGGANACVIFSANEFHS